MKHENFIANVIKVLLCLFIAFALVFFPPSSAHAAQGVHSDHSKTEQTASHGSAFAHSHIAAQMDCSTSTEKSPTDSGPHQCCSGMCLSVILVDGVASPSVNATLLSLEVRHSKLAAADPNGFLRPPKPLI